MFGRLGTGCGACATPAVTVCWSIKGGSGTTVVAAALGLMMRPPVLLVDLAGDLPATYGVAEPVGPGVHDWLCSDAEADALDHVAIDVVPGLEVIPVGTARAPHDHPRWTDLATALIGDPRPVVVDAGVGPPPRGLLGEGVRSLLVTRQCYLALRRMATVDHRPDGIVLVREPGRSLGAVDVEIAVGAPVLARVDLDPAVARAVDAGLLAARLPAGLGNGLRRAAA